MTPLGHGLLTGMTEVSDPLIADAMTRMLGAATPRELNQTLQEMTALATALCERLGDLSNTTSREVLDTALAR
jgi:hypothetical protein